MKLIFLPANQAWAFMFGDQITPMGDYGRFFQSRDEAVAAALRQGLSVLSDGTVEGIKGDGTVIPSLVLNPDPELATAMLPPANTPGREKQGNILDPIHATLDPRVFDNPAAPEPTLKPELQEWITQTVFEVLERHGYDNPQNWLTLVLTGSLCTYQYSEKSDCDLNFFVDSKRFPDWSRAEIVGIVVNNLDNIALPGTPHPLQCFVLPPGITLQDKFKPGLRAGIVVIGKGAGTWLAPPDRENIHDVEHEMNDAYTVGLLSADKLNLLMRFEPTEAKKYWHDLHQRRRDDHDAGKGDFSTSNIIYKMIVNRFGEDPVASLA